MTDWRVSLEFVDDSSSKFWRARIDGLNLYVNFGRIGTGGQTQVKRFDAAAEAEKELAKLEREKRKKGYVDAGAAGAAADEGDEEEEAADEAEDEDEAPAKPPVRPVPAAGAPTGPTANLVFDRDGRRVELTLTAAGAEVRLVAVEKYANAEAARAAFERTRAGIESEGYQPK